MKNKRKRKNIVRLTQIILLCSIPAIIFLSFIWYYQYTQATIKISKLKLKAQIGIKDIIESLDSAKYIASKLIDIFNSSKNTNQLQNNIATLIKTSNINFKYIIWTNKKKFEYANFDYHQLKGNITSACNLFYKIHVLHTMRSEKSIDRAALANLQHIFGPQFIAKYINVFWRNQKELLIPDSANKLPHLWIRTKRKFTLIIFIQNKILKEKYLTNIRIKQLNDRSKNIKFSIINSNNHVSPSKIRKLFKYKKRPYHRLFGKFEDNFIVITSYINNKLNCIAIIKTNRFTHSHILYIAIFITTLITLLLILVIDKLISLKLFNFHISLKTKFTYLFILFSLIPISIFLILGHNYLSQLKKVEITKVYNKGTTYLEHIDKLYISEESLHIKTMVTKLKKITPDLISHGITEKTISPLFLSLKPIPLRFVFVGSTTPIIVTESNTENNIHNSIKIQFPHLLGESYYRGKPFSKIMTTIGKLFIAKLNNQPITARDSAKLDFLATSLGKTSSTGLIQHFLENNGIISAFGFSKYNTPFFSYAFSLLDSTVIDYAIIYAWNKWSLAVNYYSRLYSYFNKNDIGLNVGIIFIDGKKSFPDSLKSNVEVTNYAMHIDDSSNPIQVRTCTWKKQKYYLMGYKTQISKTAFLIGLYPCDRIDRVIKRKRNLFIIFGTIGFLVSILFGLSISTKVMSPISDIKKGIEAMNQGKYTYRIPNLGQDEFGELAKLINETMEDKKELQITNNLNNILFENLEKTLQLGDTSFFGKASLLTGDGKDYLDYFLVEGEQKICFIWAKINKTGVASNLLAAYLKSCCLLYQDMQTNCKEFSKNIAKLIAKINTSENIISFQYYVFNTTEHKLETSGIDNKRMTILNLETKQFRQATNTIEILSKNEILICHSQELAENNSFRKALLSNSTDNLEAFYTSVFNGIKSKTTKDVFSMAILKIG